MGDDSFMFYLENKSTHIHTFCVNVLHLKGRAYASPHIATCLRSHVVRTHSPLLHPGHEAHVEFSSTQYTGSTHRQFTVTQQMVEQHHPGKATQAKVNQKAKSAHIQHATDRT